MAWRTWGPSSWRAWSVPFLHSTTRAGLQLMDGRVLGLSASFPLSSPHLCLRSASPPQSSLFGFSPSTCPEHPVCCQQRCQEGDLACLRKTWLPKDFQSCLGSPKAKLRATPPTVQPNMIPFVLPPFPTRLPLLYEVPAHTPPNSYMDSEARGTLVSCSGVGLPETFFRGFLLISRKAQ